MTSGNTAQDPWGQVEDIDGQELYRVLGIEPEVSQSEIKKAYRQLAKRCHPDKGGDAVTFSRIQHAFEVLSDPHKREVYDTWAKELQYRYVRGVVSRAPGGEDLLLDEFENLGLHCDPLTQLVVTCEVCRRPATKECWTCGMSICEFCTLKRHWKGEHPLHWPLINSDHMKYTLAKNELEKKKLEDAKRYLLEDPNYRNEHELRDIDAFQEAAVRMAARSDKLIAYDQKLARFYMWAQTEYRVYIAINIPTGYKDKELKFECTPHALLLQPQGSPPVLERAFCYSLDTSMPIDSFRTEDNRAQCVSLCKGTPGQRWKRLFQGDPDGVRCLEPPYRITELSDDVSVELELPFWIDSEDIRVQITSHQLSIQIRNEVSLHRTYWRNLGEEDKQKSDYAVVDPHESSWCLDDEDGADGEAVKVLMVTLVKPPLSHDEITWKKGVRMDNRAAERHDGPQRKGYRFFVDDEDEFLLEDLLQAHCFLEQGWTYVPAKPWEQGIDNVKRQTDVQLLNENVRKLLEKFLDQVEGRGEMPEQAP